MKKFSKLAFFDFDGTLTECDEFIYTTLWNYFGIPQGDDIADFERYKRGEITYPQWVAHDIERFQEVKATKPRFIEAIKRTYPINGARELLGELRKRGYGIIVVSGGIDLAVGVAYPDHEQLFDEVYINRYYFNDAGELIGAEPTPYDQKHKATCILDMCKKYGVSVKDTIFVGDNVNDVEAAQTAGISFAFNTAKPSIIAAATHHIKKKDLREILHFI